jgi:gliding motility-associated-like protein
MFKRLLVHIVLFVLVFLATFFAYAGEKIHFIENKNQWEEKLRFRADIPGGKLYLQNNMITYLFYSKDEVSDHHHHHRLDELHFHAVSMEFLGANPNPRFIKNQPVEWFYNYYLGRDRTKWASRVHAYSQLLIKDIYPGIDLELQGEADHIKYTFLISPEGNPEDIQIRYEGQDKIKVRKNQLRIKTSIVEIIEFMPEVYQLSADEKRPLACKFSLTDNVLGFSFPEGYAIDLPLIIDPTIIFASYSGSYADNFGYTATYDDSGYAYSAGTVFNPGFPVQTGAYQVSYQGGHGSTVYGSGDARDVGVLKYLPDGSSLVYATYLGGSGNEDPHSLVVDHNHNLIVFGNTSSTDFPIGNSFYDSSYNGSFDIFLAKFSLNGDSLLASTYHGGSDEDGLNGYYTLPLNGSVNQSKLGFNYGDSYRGEVIVDSFNRIYVSTTTKSPDFPYTSGVFQTSYGGGGQDACVIKYNSGLDTLLASSFLGGLKDDAGYGIALNSANQIYVCGGTESHNLPVTSAKYQDAYQGGDADGYIFYLSNDLTQILSGSYFGTAAYDQVYFIQTDDKDFVYVTGQTKSDSFPVKNVAYSENKGKQFISKLNPGLDSLLYSTVFGTGGANPDLSPSAFLVDICERVYFSGWGGSLNNDFSRNTNSFTFGLSTTKDAFQKNTDGSDFYLVVFSRDVQSLLYATFFGGSSSNDHVDGGTSRFDKNGIVYQSVCASCGGFPNDFPTYPVNVHSTTNNSNNCNNAIFKIDLDIPDLEADFAIDTIFCLADSTRILNLTQGGKTYYWDFGIPNRTDDTSTAFEPLFQYTDTGTYTITLYVSNINSCDLFDTFSQLIYVYNQSNSDFSFSPRDCVNEIDFHGVSTYGQYYSWDFGDTNSQANHSSEKDPVHVFSDTGSYRVTLYVDSGSVCEHITQKIVHVPSLPVVDFSFEIDTCAGEVVFYNSSQFSQKFSWSYGDQDSSDLTDSVHTHIYSYVDSFAVHLVAMPGTVCADTISKSFEIITPAADALLAIDTCNYRVNFYNPSQYVYQASYWDFGDGNDSLYLDTIMNYQYDTAGVYSVMLVANMGTLCLDTVYKSFELPPLPQAAFQSLTVPCEPDVKFKNTSQDANRFYWDFGNGKTANTQDSSMISYDSAGTYLVQLIAISPESCRDTFTDTLDIQHLAKADFRLDWDTCTNHVEFNNFSSKGGQYTWDFGDGSSLTNTDSLFAHEYDTNGIYKDTSRLYQVRLIVEDAPCSDTAFSEVRIYVPPKINFLVDYDSCSPIAVFTSQSVGARNFYWQFGDGDSSSQQNIVHEYEESGDYEVLFMINRNDICTDSITQSISVTRYEPEEIIVPNIMTPNNDGLNELFKIEGLNFYCDYYELFIYNRWGQLLFHAENEDIFWDATVDGKSVPDGTYFYVLYSNFIDKAGTITVVR